VAVAVVQMDINLFRVDKGGNPDLIRESQRRRYAKVELVDDVITLDRVWVSSPFFSHLISAPHTQNDARC
jgi:hypothetical protein